MPPVDRRQFIAATAAFAISGTTRVADPSISGLTVTELAPFDALMSDFVRENDVPGATLAVTRHGKLVYARGFGYADKVKQQPVNPTSLFRIASISKPFTSAAVMQLIEKRKLKLDDPVMKHIKLEAHTDGKKPDPRWKDITVRHCLQHTGGWDRDKPNGGFDPIGIPWKIAKALEIDTPVPPKAIVRYMMGQPLDFDPGHKYAYSNFGYLVLGRVMEAVTEDTYEKYVKKNVLAPVGITTMALGRALPELRFKGEVKYYDSKKATAKCLYPPRVGQMVPKPDGGENFEAFEAHGGWVASAPDLLRFAAAFDKPKESPLLKLESIRTMFARPDLTPAKGKVSPNYYGCGWEVYAHDDGTMNTFHSGVISGQSSLLVRRADGLSWAVLFNTDANQAGKGLTGLIDAKLHKAADSVRKWPEIDQFEKLSEKKN